jgi:hypothetical protein
MKFWLEVGEIRNHGVNLDEFITPIGKDVEFVIEQAQIDTQDFINSLNPWGVSNNSKGTNTSRVVFLQKL